MNKPLRTALVCLIAVCAPLCAFAQNTRTELHRGIEYYKQSDFRSAANVFQGIANAKSAEQGDACFWLARSLTALERYQEAANFLENFLKNFPTSPYYPEAFYERGRILYYQKEYDSAIVSFQNFLDRYPESDYAANAYFWTGESLFALGNLEPAERMYATVVTRYPTSSRVEAARYRAALIGLKYREEELLKLLKWSHEEYLKSLEARTNLERTYAEVVSSYQRQIAALNTSDLHAEVIRLSEEARVLKTELEARKTGGARPPVTDSEFDARIQILSAREESLRLREVYLNQLIREYEEKK
ncbi:MAG: tetratricopeptide repeat protein [Spirochaetales bacterium]|nr:tetratricopeptide repeat protein [Spirochaetales bacterium]